MSFTEFDFSHNVLFCLAVSEISSQECQRVKIRRVAEERLLASDENGIFTSGQQHLAFSDDASQECSRALSSFDQRQRNPWRVVDAMDNVRLHH